MGCRKLTYYTTETTPLKVATGKGLESEKVVQGFLSVDPKVHDARLIGHSPYHFGYNNPIKYIDTEGDIPWSMVVAYTRVTSQQGNRIHPIHKESRYHAGLDLAARTGSDVRAMAGGKIAKVGWDPDGYGRYVVIKHPKGYYTLYAHLEKESVNLEKGTNIKNGEVIGKSGNSGGSTGPHLHLEVIKAENLNDIFKNENKLDPQVIGDLENIVNPDNPLSKLSKNDLLNQRETLQSRISITENLASFRANIQEAKGNMERADEIRSKAAEKVDKFRSKLNDIETEIETRDNG